MNLPMTPDEEFNFLMQEQGICVRGFSASKGSIRLYYIERYKLLISVINKFRSIHAY